MKSANETFSPKEGPDEHVRERAVRGMDDDDLFELCGVGVGEIIEAWEAEPTVPESSSVTPSPIPRHQPHPTTTHNNEEDTDDESRPQDSNVSADESSGVQLSTMKAVPKQKLDSAIAQSIPLRRAAHSPSEVTRHDLDSLDAFYLDNVLSPEECEELVEWGESIGFTFWDQGTDIEHKKAFRNADTIELISENVAQEIFHRIEPHLQVTSHFVTSRPSHSVTP